MHFQPEHFLTRSLTRVSSGSDICQVIASAMNSADAESAVLRNISFRKDSLIVGSKTYDLSTFKHIYILGVGKAVLPMAYAVYHLLENHITAGVLITKDGYISPASSTFEHEIKILQACHPIPDQRNLTASKELYQFLKHFREEDLVICLISGGGSSLLIKPAVGISLIDLQETTRLLLNSGATINEINTIRKHLDEFKGGNLAKLCSPASVIGLILSDVVGDRLDMVASGPTVADPSTFQDAWSIMAHYQLLDQIPHAVRLQLEKGMRGEVFETVKPGDLILDHTQNYLVGNNTQCIHAALHTANSIGFDTKLITTSLHGEASQVGKSLAETAKSLYLTPSKSKPICMVAGGETTVTIHGDGKGGRNQELVLGAVKSIAGEMPLVFVSLGTDGGDGPTDAAGALATNETYSLGFSMGLDPSEYLQRNDSYHYFEAMGDLIKTGPTLTNVNDLVFIFGL
jgi:glycerate 2-kinase